MEKLFSGKAWRLPTSNSVVNTAVEALDVARSSEQLAGHGLFGDFKIKSSLPRAVRQKHVLNCCADFIPRLVPDKKP